MKWRKWSKKAAVTLATGGAVSMGLTGPANADVLIHSDGFAGDNLGLPGGQSYGSNAGANDANWSVSEGA